MGYRSKKITLISFFCFSVTAFIWTIYITPLLIREYKQEKCERAIQPELNDFFDCIYSHSIEEEDSIFSKLKKTCKEDQEKVMKVLEKMKISKLDWAASITQSNIWCKEKKEKEKTLYLSCLKRQINLHSCPY